jgi:ArsR family transcriptional regulator, lead/cadmium/zinc/bismuth-responsive transcriptional repressor
MSDDCCDLLFLDLPRAERLRGRRLPPDQAGHAAARAAALAEPTRLMLAASLEEGGEMCVCDLAWIAERSPALVSHHLRRLRAAGLVSSRRQGKMVLYTLTPDAQELLGAVLGAATARVERGS